MNDNRESILTNIWDEIPEPDNPFAASICYCHGYDVYGEILANASWTEYLYLLFLGEKPVLRQVKLLDALAIALAHPGIRDPSVHAAMSGGAGGSTNAACLMAALAVGAGQHGGAHEVYRAVENWNKCQQDLAAWRKLLLDTGEDEPVDTWLPMEHAPGFDPHGASCATPVRKALAHFAGIGVGTNLSWLQQNQQVLEELAGMPLGMPGVAAAAFVDLNLNPNQAEALYLVLRLPGAAVHALEQREHGWRQFPTFSEAIHLKNDPGPNKVMSDEAERS